MEHIMKIVIIGGTGHIGTFLTPRLVRLGHEVTVLSRGRRRPYLPDPAWKQVQMAEVDRGAEEKAGTFGKRVAGLEPEVVVDLTCFSLASCRQLVDELRGTVQHFLHCGTLWVNGPGCERPTREDHVPRPTGDYGTNKLAIENYLLNLSRCEGFPASVLHPGHIVGPGWWPINPAGHFATDTWLALAEGRELALPNLGLETLHHVHADDVAQSFERAIACWNTSVGEAFHVASPAAITLRGYAEAAAGWFGREANIRCMALEEWKTTLSESDAAMTLEHISRSPCASIDKARRAIGYQPRYSSLEAVREAVAWQIDHGNLSAKMTD
jgi:nucleoside-diphosphate-sugar epimerase